MACSLAADDLGERAAQWQRLIVGAVREWAGSFLLGKALGLPYERLRRGRLRLRPEGS